MSRRPPASFAQQDLRAAGVALRWRGRDGQIRPLRTLAELEELLAKQTMDDDDEISPNGTHWTAVGDIPDRAAHLWLLWMQAESALSAAAAEAEDGATVVVRRDVHLPSLSGESRRTPRPEPRQEAPDLAPLVVRVDDFGARLLPALLEVCRRSRTGLYLLGWAPRGVEDAFVRAYGDEGRQILGARLAARASALDEIRRATGVPGGTLVRPAGTLVKCLSSLELPAATLVWDQTSAEVPGPEVIQQATGFDLLLVRPGASPALGARVGLRMQDAGDERCRRLAVSLATAWDGVVELLVTGLPRDEKALVGAAQSLAAGISGCKVEVVGLCAVDASRAVYEHLYEARTSVLVAASSGRVAPEKTQHTLQIGAAGHALAGHAPCPVLQAF